MIHTYESATGEMATAPPPRTGTRFAIDATRTSVTMRGRWFGLRTTATVQGMTGELEVPDDLRATSLRATIAPGAAVTGPPWRRPRARRSERAGGALAGAVLTADRLQPILDSYTTPDGDRPLWAMDGQLTLHGHRRPVRLALCVLRPSRDGSAVEFEATATVRPADFGLASGRGRAGEVHVRIVGHGAAA